MKDRTLRGAQKNVKNTAKSRERALEHCNDDDVDENAKIIEKPDGRDEREAKQTKKSRTTKEPPPDLYRSRKRMSSGVEEENDGSGRKNTTMAARNTQMNDEYTQVSPVEGSDKEAGNSEVDIEQLRADGPPGMYILKGADTETVDARSPVMLMKVPRTMTRKIQDQILTGQAYRRERNVSISKLERELRMNRLVLKSVEQRFQEMAKLRGDRAQTPQESALAKRLHQEKQETLQEIKRIEQKRTTLSRDVELVRRTWEDNAISVEDVLKDVFVRCGLFDDAKATSMVPIAPQVDNRNVADKSRAPEVVEGVCPKLRPDETQSTKKAVIDEPLSVGKAIVILREAKARKEKHEAQRLHDEHRGTFRRGLAAARVAAASNRPDAPKRLVEEEFSRDYVRTGCELAGAVTHAEAAHEAMLAAAAEAQVSIIGSDDDMDPNIPYDLEEYKAVKMKNLDRDAVEDWNEAVEVRVKPDLPPLGYLLHMADKWEKALEADDEISNAGEESISDAGVEHHGETPAVHDSVLKPVSIGKSRNAQPFLCLSDYAKGKKRRRIDNWMREIQQPVVR
jgi:hypothetical protein